MNPRKAKDLCSEVATILSLPEELVKDLTDFHWNETHKLLTSLDHYHVRVNHLGTFNIRGRKHLTKTIEKLEEQVKPNRGRKIKSQFQYVIFTEKEALIIKLNKLLSQWHREIEERKQNKELRKQIRDAKDLMESQKTDS